LPVRAVTGFIYLDWFQTAVCTAIIRTWSRLRTLHMMQAFAEIFVHAFTDGRDTSPTGGAAFLETCEKELEKSGGRIVTVVGRYFAMDRDRRWDRTKKAWDAVVLGAAKSANPRQRLLWISNIKMARRTSSCRR